MIAKSEGALQVLQRVAHGGDRLVALVQFVRDEVNHGLGIGVGFETMSLGLELGAKLAEIFDDAVVDDRHLRRHVRMSVALGRAAVRGPARVADAGAARERLAEQTLLEISQFAFGAAAIERAAFDGRDAG